MAGSGNVSRALIEQLIKNAGASDATEAIRAKAHELLGKYVAAFGDPQMPMNVEVLASLCGITQSSDVPVHSPDAELVPDGRGGVTMRVNPNRPETRQRFSIAHEISHTFFPNYESKTWCRPDPRYRDRLSADDYIETLCDIGASELLLPQPWFGREADRVTNGDELIQLAATFHASLEATLRRYAEVSSDSLAVVFFVWKLKPSQARFADKKQGKLFGITAEEMRRNALKLRIEYSVPSPLFKKNGIYLPPDKSVEQDNAIYEAAASGTTVCRDCNLDLGKAGGYYSVWAIPLWTADEDLGPAGESSVAAVLRPLSHRSHSRDS